MNKDAELQAKIAALAGGINQHKRQLHPGVANGAPHGGQWSPFARRGRGGRGGFKHANRTLVLNASRPIASPASDPATPNNEPAASPNPPPDAFIATRRRGMNQLINRDTYDREQKQKQDHHDRTRVVKRQKIDRDERSRLTQFTSTQGHREVILEGIRFQLCEDGSKLIRVSGKRDQAISFANVHDTLNLPDDNTTKETPRSVKIADVDFFRTKNGNLVRGNALKDAKRYLIEPNVEYAKDLPYPFGRLQSRKKTAQCEDFAKNGTQTPSYHRLDQRRPRTRTHCYLPAGKSQSSLTLALGKCSRGPMCHFAHDPDKVTVCPKFLKSACTNGDECDLSHSPTYSNTPACTHFLRGNCTNDACRYPHVNVSPTAPVCATFARLGYCDSQNCDKRHVFECPDYANTGYCAKATTGRCSLPHPDRAATLRKAAAKQAKMGSEDDSDVSSDGENEEDALMVDDVDSDDIEDMTMSDVQNYNHDLTQQRDFIAFS